MFCWLNGVESRQTTEFTTRQTFTVRMIKGLHFFLRTLQLILICGSKNIKLYFIPFYLPHSQNRQENNE